MRDDKRKLRDALRSLPPARADDMIADALIGKVPDDINAAIEAYADAVGGERRYGLRRALRVALFRIWLMSD